MMYENKFMTFDQMEKHNSGTRYKEGGKKVLFCGDHPGHYYSYLNKLDHFVIPKISMTAGKLCNVEEHPYQHCMALNLPAKKILMLSRPLLMKSCAAASS